MGSARTQGERELLACVAHFSARNDHEEGYIVILSGYACGSVDVFSGCDICPAQFITQRVTNQEHEGGDGIIPAISGKVSVQSIAF